MAKHTHRPHRRWNDRRGSSPQKGSDRFRFRDANRPPHRPHNGPNRPALDHPPPPPASGTEPAEGTLELSESGDGFLRDARRNYAIHPADAYVPRETASSLKLRGGEQIVGLARPSSNGRPPTLATVQTINGRTPGEYAATVPFEELTVIDPREMIHFETPGGPLTMRVVDLLTPIGKGQRGLLVAPPRTGKTILLTQMAAAIRTNHPDIRMMMLLIDERPEEVTEMKRSVAVPNPQYPDNTPEVVYSSNDKDIESHVRIARLMIAKAKRRVEQGEQVLILLDSLTRLGRAFNAYVGTSGRTMSGGIDIRALTEPKAMFGAARNIEHGGSLTIIASALIETGSRMDEFIFQEFKGTGNMELVLSRELANLRIWPAMDVAQSGTRKEELLLPAAVVPKVYRLRRQLTGLPRVAQVQTLVEQLAKHPSNEAFLATIA